MIDEAYATFRHPAIAPLVQTGPNAFVMELFHGSTLAFKDVAMQLLARLMDYVLAERGERATIVGATSAIPVARPSTPLPGASAPTSSSSSRMARFRRSSSAR